jgi:hypothetical protein
MTGTFNRNATFMRPIDGRPIMGWLTCIRIFDQKTMNPLIGAKSLNNAKIVAGAALNKAT